ncbi:ABC-type nitrate/sulfonate/bicarbonate transport system substrate-binding protein [Motilibacter rhizosphaerae]|uniref:Thiamine pyrimidine synthase n=1 Tax=Motilibacter rhizosphaerae TaxID=598652 RepID=A0A4Q7NXQ0_9ACTN|nr:ABC transporter substrate-binding protein [Motilibacter rhizosphaerae]RZS91698.1 ABC-type nitrate/sulfonate/bicarbonate transport system substrate-binding protein [Motilibacter rhizosphaerae]
MSETPTTLSRRSALRLFGAGAATLLGGGLLSACGSSDKEATSSSTPATGGASAAAGGASGTTKAAIQLAYLKNVQFAGSFFAEEKGYYAAGGLDVDLIAGGPNLAVEPVVASGKALVGITHTAELAKAVSNGAKLTCIGAGFQKNPFCVLSLASNPITKPEDMIGKKIGVSATNVPVWQAFLKANKIDASKIHVVTVQFDPTPLASKEIDGLVAFYTNEPIVLEVKGIKTHSMLLNDFGYPLLEDLYIAKTADLADPTKRKQIVALMTAEAKGWQDAVADPQQAATLAVTKYGKDLKLDMQQQVLDMKAQNDLVVSDTTKAHGLFWMTDEDIASTIKSLALGGVTASPGLFSNDVLKDVYKGGATAA